MGSGLDEIKTEDVRETGNVYEHAAFRNTCTSVEREMTWGKEINKEKQVWSYATGGKVNEGPLKERKEMHTERNSGK